MLVLQAHKLNKTYGDRHILQEVSFALHKGERVGLVGVNGCGKSTLLKCITGEIAPDSGEISIATGHSLAYLEQIPRYASESTLWEIVMGAYRNLLDMREEMRNLELSMAQAGEHLD